MKSRLDKYIDLHWSGDIAGLSYEQLEKLYDLDKKAKCPYCNSVMNFKEYGDDYVYYKEYDCIKCNKNLTYCSG